MSAERDDDNAKAKFEEISAPSAGRDVAGSDEQGGIEHAEHSEDNADSAPTEAESDASRDPEITSAPTLKPRSTPHHTKVHHHSSDPAEEAADLTSTVLATPAPAPPRVSSTDAVARPDEDGDEDTKDRSRSDLDAEKNGAGAGTGTGAQARAVPPAPAPKRIASHIEYSPAPPMKDGRTWQGKHGSHSAVQDVEETEQAMGGMNIAGLDATKVEAPAEKGAPGGRPATGKALPALDISEFDPFGTPSHSSRAPVPSNTNQGGRSRLTDPSGGSQPSAQSDISRSATPPPLPSKSAPPRTPGQPATSSRAERSLHQIENHAAQADRDQQPEPGSADAESSQTRQSDMQSQDDHARREKEKEEPAFNFSGFLRDLRTKPAEPIARYLKSFLTNFAKKPFTVNEQIKLIHDFLRFINDKMVQYEPWKSQTPAELDNAMEAMEKLVMNRLYNYTFTPQLVPQQPITTDDLERDAVFAQRVRLFGWVEGKHLDVPSGEASKGFLDFAALELVKINHYKAPRDKMICILNCCKVIFGLIRHAAGHGAGAEATSADAFVPILIYVVLKANPNNLLSNVEYINRFRSADKLRGESGYYLSSLSGAIAFIETMDATSLSSITVDEFEANVEKAVKELPPSPTTVNARGHSAAAGGPSSYPAPSNSGRSGGGDNAFGSLSGEEPARALLLPGLSKGSLGFGALGPGQASASGQGHDGDSTPSRALAFLSRTGEAAAEAVSRPLGAIGKILEGIQDVGGSASGSEDGDADDRRQQQQQQQHNQRQPPTPQNAHRLHRPRGMERAQTPDFYWSESPVRPSPTHGQQGLAHGHGQSPHHSQLQPGHEHRPPPPHSYQHQPEGEGGDESFNFSRAATPMRDGPAEELQHTLDASFETHAQSQAQAQMRQANVQTLQQMFPALDEEVLEAVLQGCEEDLGLAIDRLLEM